MEETKLARMLEEKKAEGILVTDPYSIRYLSGFSGGEGALLLTEGKQILITDSRYTEAAGRETDFQIEEESRERRRGQILKEQVKEQGIRSLGIEDGTITLREYRALQEDLAGVTFLPLGTALEELRAVKAPWELERIRRAEAIGDAAFARVLPLLKPGLTELEVAAELEYQMKLLGAEGLSFDTIVASGLNSSMPHAVPGEKKLEAGDFVTMDFGCRYRGYCSDMTRTVVLGKAGQRQKEIYETVRKAQEAALLVIRAGIRGKEADRAAREVIGEAGYGAFFGHSLGHSLGLFIHEQPSLSPVSEKILLPGMVETVEPGIYVPGFGGVRIEDLVLVTETGCENLTSSPKEMIEL